MNTRALWTSIILATPWATAPAQPLGVGLPAPLIQNVTNAPNPFDARLSGSDGETQIQYFLSAPSDVHVTIYDLFGFKVREWSFSADREGGHGGPNQFRWDGTNAAGQKVAKGGYLAVLEVDNAAGHAKTIRKIGVLH